LEKQGRVPEAIEEFQVSLGIAARLAASDPSNAARRRDLYASYRNLGLVQERGGRSGEARATYCRAKEVISAETALEPEWQQRLGWLEQRLAGLRALGVSPC
jgi:hypothetical protein